MFERIYIFILTTATPMCAEGFPSLEHGVAAARGSWSEPDIPTPSTPTADARVLLNPTVRVIIPKVCTYDYKLVRRILHNFFLNPFQLIAEVRDVLTPGVMARAKAASPAQPLTPGLLAEVRSVLTPATVAKAQRASWRSSPDALSVAAALADADDAMRLIVTTTPTLQPLRTSEWTDGALNDGDEEEDAEDTNEESFSEAAGADGESVPSSPSKPGLVFASTAARAAFLREQEQHLSADVSPLLAEEAERSVTTAKSRHLQDAAAYVASLPARAVPVPSAPHESPLAALLPSFATAAARRRSWETRSGSASDTAAASATAKNVTTARGGVVGGGNGSGSSTRTQSSAPSQAAAGTIVPSASPQRRRSRLATSSTPSPQRSLPHEVDSKLKSGACEIDTRPMSTPALTTREVALAEDAANAAEALVETSEMSRRLGRRTTAHGFPSLEHGVANAKGSWSPPSVVASSAAASAVAPRKVTPRSGVLSHDLSVEAGAGALPAATASETPAVRVVLRGVAFSLFTLSRSNSLTHTSSSSSFPPLPL
jgi:hypothetical protein